DRQCERTAKDRSLKLGPECHVIACAPFVLAGDFEAGELDELYRTTIEPAVRAMRRSYFDVEPNEPVSVLVFRGEESYNRYCALLSDEYGISIYGYYKPKFRTLVLKLG